jgi:hypothetical protein
VFGLPELGKVGLGVDGVEARAGGFGTVGCRPSSFRKWLDVKRRDWMKAKVAEVRK